VTPTRQSMSTSLGRLIVVVVVVVSRFEWWIRGATTSAKTARWRCARRTARGDRHARGLLYHRPSARPSSPNAAESLCVVHPHHARKARRGKASGGWMDTNARWLRRASGLHAHRVDVEFNSCIPILFFPSRVTDRRVSRFCPASKTRASQRDRGAPEASEAGQK